MGHPGVGQAAGAVEDETPRVRSLVGVGEGGEHRPRCRAANDVARHVGATASLLAGPSQARGAAGAMWVLWFSVGGADVSGCDERQGGAVQPGHVPLDDLRELRQLRHVLIHVLDDELPPRAISPVRGRPLGVEDVAPATGGQTVGKVLSPKSDTVTRVQHNVKQTEMHTY